MINTPTLKHLKELVQLTQASSVLSELSTPSEKTILGLLYRTILDNPDASDEEIAGVVYGSGTKTTLPAFRKLKTRLRNRLIDALISVEVMDKVSTTLSRFSTRSVSA